MPARPVHPVHPLARFCRTRATRPVAQAAAALALALLAACGGGGSGSADSGNPVVPSAATITASNYEGVARQAVTAANYLGDTSGLVTGAQVAPGAQALFAFSRAQATRLGSLLARSPRLATGATTTDTVNCAGGGSISARLTDVNGNGAVDTGDSGVLTANNCVEAGATISGTLSISFSAVSGKLDTDVYSATVAFSLQNLVASTAAGSVSGNGQFTMAITSTGASSQTVALVVPSLSLSGTLGGVNDTITLQDYQVSSSTVLVGGRLRTTSSVSGGMSSANVAGGLVTLATLQPLVQFDSDAYFSSGQLQASGANNSRLRLTVLSASTVLLELDANGDGTVDASMTRAWSDLV